MTGNIHLNPKVKGRHCSSLGSFIKVIYLYKKSRSEPPYSWQLHLLPRYSWPEKSTGCAKKGDATGSVCKAKSPCQRQLHWALRSDGFVKTATHDIVANPSSVDLWVWWSICSMMTEEFIWVTWLRFPACPSGSSRKWWHPVVDSNFEWTRMET